MHGGDHRTGQPHEGQQRCDVEACSPEQPDRSDHVRRRDKRIVQHPRCYWFSPQPNGRVGEPVPGAGNVGTAEMARECVPQRLVQPGEMHHRADHEIAGQDDRDEQVRRARGRHTG